MLSVFLPFSQDSTTDCHALCESEDITAQTADSIERQKLSKVIDRTCFALFAFIYLILLLRFMPWRPAANPSRPSSFLGTHTPIDVYIYIQYTNIYIYLQAASKKLTLWFTNNYNIIFYVVVFCCYQLIISEICSYIFLINTYQLRTAATYLRSIYLMHRMFKICTPTADTWP